MSLTCLWETFIPRKPEREREKGVGKEEGREESKTHKTHTCSVALALSSNQLHDLFNWFTFTLLPSFPSLFLPISLTYSSFFSLSLTCSQSLSVTQSRTIFFSNFFRSTSLHFLVLSPRILVPFLSPPFEETVQVCSKCSQQFLPPSVQLLLRLPSSIVVKTFDLSLAFIQHLSSHQSTVTCFTSFQLQVLI